MTHKKKRELRKKRLLKCHQLELKCRRTTSHQQRFAIYLVILMILISFETICAQEGSLNSLFTDQSNAVEDDELSKTLDRSNNEEWNLNQASTGNQEPPADESSQWLMIKQLKLEPSQGAYGSGSNFVTTNSQSYTNSTNENGSENPNHMPNERVDDQFSDAAQTESANEFIGVVNNQSNIVFNEPIDVIKYAASDQLTSFTGGAPSNSSNHTVTRYGWKSAHNSEPIVSVIKTSNSSSHLAKVIHLNEGKLNATPPTADEVELKSFTSADDEDDKSRFKLSSLSENYRDKSDKSKKIYKSYSIMSSKKKNPTESEGFNRAEKPHMISYSLKETDATFAGSPGKKDSSQNRVVLTVAPSSMTPTPLRKHQPINKQRTILRAPLIITEDQLRMIADSEDSNSLFFKGEEQASARLKPPTRDSFMFDASLFPVALNLMSSSSVSASELVPQTTAYLTSVPSSSYETDESKQLAMSGERQQQAGRQRKHKLSFENSDTDFASDGDQLSNHQTNQPQQHEPIVVETSPAASSVAGQTATQQITITNGGSEQSETDDNSATDHNDSAHQEPFDTPPDENLQGNDPLSTDSDSVDTEKKAKVTSNEPDTLKTSGDQANKHRQQMNEQQQAAGNKREPEQELLVGPFKSESEAPATITLSGVVYQKSGSSSSIVKSGPSPQRGNQKQTATLSLTRSVPPIKQTAPATSGGGKVSVGEQLDKYWPYSSIYVRPSGATSLGTQLGNNDILFGSMKSGAEQPLSAATLSSESATGSQIRIPQASSSSYSTTANQQLQGGGGGLRLSPFSFSRGALLASSNSQNTNQLLPGDEGLQLEDLDLLSPPKELVTKLNFKDSPPILPEALGGSSSMLLDSAASTSAALTSAAASGLSHQQQQQQAPVWASSIKSGEQYFLGNLNVAPTESSYHHHQEHHMHKHRQKSGPIVIVQKDVKPVKYHILRAYLKLRRLLRPFEATYLFSNDPHSSMMMKRRQRAPRLAASRLLLLKAARKSVAAAATNSSIV